LYKGKAFEVASQCDLCYANDLAAFALQKARFPCISAPYKSAPRDYYTTFAEQYQ
jgi:hypothetical protein